MPRYPLFLLALACVGLAGCDGQAACEVGCGPPDDDDAEVFVVNQGNFSTGNGTLARFDPERVVVDSTAALGGLLQSATLHAGRLYVTVNTANRIDVFDTTTLTRVLQITVAAPRYVAFVSDTKAYVSSQFYDFGGSIRPDIVSIVNPQTGALLDSVQVGGNAEGIGIVGGRAYVAVGAFSESHDVIVLDTSTDTAIDTIDVGCAPRLALPDAEGDVFVVCAGGAPGADEVVVLDGATGTEEGRIAAGTVSTLGPGQDAHLSLTAAELYVAQADGRVIRIDTRTNSVVATLGPLGSDPIGAVSYDAPTGRLYVAHAPRGLEFIAGGYVTAHDRAGAEVRRFRSGGVAPSHLITRPRP
jgi:DNA-binding beta-propeller fold protein YncE